jgi:hypothetical protein
LTSATAVTYHPEGSGRLADTVDETGTPGGAVIDRWARPVRGRSLAMATALLAAVALTPVRAAAIDLNALWPDLGLPGFKISPFVSQRVEYESNIFQAPSRAQDDVIFKTIPGFALELPLGRHKVDLGFSAEIVRYADLGSQDTEHYFVLGNLLLDFPGGLRVNVKEDFARTSDPPGTELTGRIESTTNVLSPSVEYAFARRYAVGLDYVWTTVNFDDDTGVEQLDRDEHTIGLTGFYRVQPRTDVLVNVAYGTKDFETASARDVDRYIAAVGVRGDLTSRLRSTLRVGYEVRDPERGEVGAYQGVVVGGDLVYRPTARTRLTLVAERAVQESVFATNVAYLANLLTLTGEHFVTRKLLLSARLTGGNGEYFEKAQKVNGRFDWREDWVAAFSLGVEYQIQRWLAVSADYTHARRESNFDNFDFKNDIVGGKVTLSF